ncbi:hypothetical protein V8E54_000682 [Elaphomyces granulatus]
MTPPTNRGRALSRELRGLGIDPDAPTLPGTFEPSVNEEPAAAAPPEPSQPAASLHDADLERKAFESRLTVLERLLADQRRPEPSTNLDLPMPSIKRTSTQLSAETPRASPRLILITCFGESLPPDVGYNKSFADAPIFDGSDKEKYKPWKRALKNKLKNSACLFPTPSAGVDYVLSRLADLPWDIVNNALENSDDGVASVEAALALLDKTFLDADEYGSALVAMKKLKMTSEDSVDGFLAQWQKLNIKLGRDQDSRPAIQEVLNKMPAALGARLLSFRFVTMGQLIDQARIIEQNLAQFRIMHPREQVTTKQAAPSQRFVTPRPPTTASNPTKPTTPTSTKPQVSADRQALMATGSCFICHQRGHLMKDCLLNPRPPYAPVYDDESSGESSSEDG